MAALCTHAAISNEDRHLTGGEIFAFFRCRKRVVSNGSKRKGPFFKRGLFSCCGGFRFVYKMRRQRTPPVYVFVFYVHGLTCLQAKVKLKVAVWPRRCACWPIQILMVSLKGLQRRRVEW